jgi:hypothetical protein
MNEKAVRKMRQYARRQVQSVLAQIIKQPFRLRLWVAWHILIGR